MRDTFIFRVDAGDEIGSGHIVRCTAIANAVKELGGHVEFAVATDASACILERYGFQSKVLGGSTTCFTRCDGRLLAEYAGEAEAGVVLVDSYAVNEEFFDELALTDTKVAFIDDLYTYATGYLQTPIRWDVRLVLNYGFALTAMDYERVYGTSTHLLVGPRFAPIRDSFVGKEYDFRPEVKRILATSGSTNYGGVLEQIVNIVDNAYAACHIDVVVGPLASFEAPACLGPELQVHTGLSDLSGLMQGADLAISAAGSTLYELACIGVPTIAIPTEENQRANALGFSGLGLGMACDAGDWKKGGLAQCIIKLTRSPSCRNAMYKACRQTLDGLGAKRVAAALLLCGHEDKGLCL